MSEQKLVTCDACGNNLTEDTRYPAKYALELQAINVAINTSGSRYAVHVTPPIDGKKHFCSFVCIKNWMEQGE